jgi:predicted neutral ceramidase superfamily lipid hydrolase
MNKLKNWIKRNILVLVFIALIINVFNIGLFMLSDTRNTLSYIGFSGAVISLVAFVIFAFLPLKYWEKLSRIFYK